MDSTKNPEKAAALLNDLESIRALLGGNSSEPPLLTEAMDPSSIPLLCEVVSNPLVNRANSVLSEVLAKRSELGIEHSALIKPSSPMDQLASEQSSHTESARLSAMTSSPSAPSPHSSSSVTGSPDQTQLSRELRKAAELVLQEVLDDFVPQIEDELRRRLQGRLNKLISKP